MILFGVELKRQTNWVKQQPFTLTVRNTFPFWCFALSAILRASTRPDSFRNTGLGLRLSFAVWSGSGGALWWQPYMVLRLSESGEIDQRSLETSYCPHLFKTRDITMALIFGFDTQQVVPLSADKGLSSHQGLPGLPGFFSRPHLTESPNGPGSWRPSWCPFCLVAVVGSCSTWSSTWGASFEGTGV